MSITVTQPGKLILTVGNISGAPLIHNHDIADVIDLQTTLDTISNDVGILGSNFSILTTTVSSNTSSISSLELNKSEVGHIHSIGNVTNLQTTLDGKASSVHSHSTSDVTGLDTSLSGKSNVGHIHLTSDVTGLDTALSGKASSVHSHSTSDVTGLDTSLSGKSNVGHIHSIGEVTGLATEIDAKANIVHSHSTSDVTGLVTALSGKSDTTHNHDATYQGKTTSLTNLSNIGFGTSLQVLRTNAATNAYEWATVSGGGGATGYAYGGTITTAPVASAEDNLAIGDGASTASAASGSIAIGSEARSLNGVTASIAIGKNAYVHNTISSGICISLGAGRSGSTSYGALGNRSIAIGGDAIASGADGLSIGNYSTASSTGSIAIGGNSSFNGGAQSLATNTIAIGQGSIAQTNRSISIGGSAKSGTGTAIINIDSSGNGYTHTGSKSVFITADTNTTITQNYTVAIGAIPASSIGATNTVVIGADGYHDVLSTGIYSTIIGGTYGKAEMSGEFVRATGRFSASGDAQGSWVVGHVRTTNASATEMIIGIGSEKIVLSNDSTYSFNVDLVARNEASDTDSAVFNLKFAIRRGANAASTTLIGTPVLTTIGVDASASSWTVGVTADTTNGRPNLYVYGEAAKNIRWVANLFITKVTG